MSSNLSLLFDTNLFCRSTQSASTSLRIPEPLMMATFNQLPNEIIIQIWEFVFDPQDAKNFDLVSKRIHDFSLPYLDEHACFRMLLSRIRISPTNRSADLFSRMFQDPRAKFHLRDLQTEKWAYQGEGPRYCEPLKALIADLKSAFEEFARCLDRVPAKRLLKGVRDGEEGQFLAFQFKQLIGWTEIKSSGTAQAHSDLFGRLERLLFPSDRVFDGGLPIANHHWEYVTMSYMTW